jgi:hypothetical protein
VRVRRSRSSCRLQAAGLQVVLAAAWLRAAALPAWTNRNIPHSLTLTLSRVWPRTPGIRSGWLGWAIASSFKANAGMLAPAAACWLAATSSRTTPRDAAAGGRTYTTSGSKTTH